MNQPPAPNADKADGLGSRIAPARFVLFLGVMAAVFAIMFTVRSAGWAEALVWGFDLAAVVFILSLWPLSRDHTADDMRRHSAANDANRAMVLVITAVVLLTVMAAIASELGAAEQGDIAAMVKLVLTLAMAWFFTNLVFMLHYAHNYYRSAQDRPGDRGGFLFPETPEPDYWDFCYFSFTMGMTFQTSDVIVTRGYVRRVVMLQCLLAFAFNIGVIAFIINTLGASA